MGLSDHNCVILQTNRARYALNKEIFDLLDKKRLPETRFSISMRGNARCKL